MALAALAACSSGTSASVVSTTVVVDVEPSSIASIASTTSSTLAPTTTTDPLPADFLGEEVIGTSVEGRPITAWHRGTEGGTVVLVVGVIHGDEDAGLPILDRLAEVDLPAGLDLWVLPALNPDGLANQVRGNGNGVDLNRNFPHDWTPIATPGEWQYSGSGPASEPETQAFIAFSTRIAPTLTLWYHQDLFCITPSKGRDRPLREAYSRISGLPIVTVTGGIYTGVAATWVRRTLDDAMSFIIELGPTVPDEERERHVEAVLAVSSMVVNGEV